jgi:hypothetical protein
MWYFILDKQTGSSETGYSRIDFHHEHVTLGKYL